MTRCSMTRRKTCEGARQSLKWADYDKVQDRLWLKARQTILANRFMTENKP